MAVAMIGGLALAGASAAQEPASAPMTAPETAATPAVGSGEDWTSFSSSGTRAYMADLASLTTGDPVKVRLARTPLNREPGDYGHTIDDYEFRCAAGQVRMVSSTEYGPDGVQTDRFEDPATWEDIPDQSLDAYLKAVACDGVRPETESWPSIKAFIDAGRPTAAGIRNAGAAVQP